LSVFVIKSKNVYLISSSAIKFYNILFYDSDNINDNGV